MADKKDYITPDISLIGAEHIRRYRETNGEVGYLWNGAPCLILTTKGRRSGQTKVGRMKRRFIATRIVLANATFHHSQMRAAESDPLYTIVRSSKPIGGVSGIGWLFVTAGVVADLVTWFGGGREGRNRYYVEAA